MRRNTVDLAPFRDELIALFRSAAATPARPHDDRRTERVMARSFSDSRVRIVPQMSTKPEEWYLHRERDIANAELHYADRAAARLLDRRELTLERFREKDRICQDAIASLAEQLADAEPDVVLVVGDDQRELFQEDCIPAIAIFIGNEVIDTAPPRNALEHPSIAAAYWARHAERPESYPVDRPWRATRGILTRQGSTSRPS